MARTPVYKYKNPKAPVDQGGEKKAFEVAPKAIISGEDINGQLRQISGQAETLEERTILLTANMASFYANSGSIIVEMDFGDDKDKENAKLRQDIAVLQRDAKSVEALQAEIEQLKAQLEGSSDVSSTEQESDDAALSAIISGGTDEPPTTDDAETGNGDTSDTSGGKSGDGHSSPTTDETPKRSRRRGRKTL